MRLLKIVLSILILTLSSFGDKTQVEGFVERFYVTVLDRASEEAGLEYWTNSLLSGSQAGADIARGFIFSEEFSNREVEDSEFLNILYRAFFDREPDIGGFNTWNSLLERGYSKNSILDGFLFSQEFTNLCSAYGISPIEVLATSCPSQYDATLDRTPQSSMSLELYSPSNEKIFDCSYSFGLTSEQPYLNGKLNGIVKSYYKGYILEEKSYINGVQEGWTLNYSRDGVLISKTNYVDEEMDGWKYLYDREGNIISKSFYIDGKVFI